MINSFNTLFGPLDVAYCNYFYIISIIGFVFFITSLGSVILSLTGKKGFNQSSMMFMVQGFLLYFVNRLLYSMCIR